MILDIRKFETFPAETILIGDSDSFNIEYEGVNALNSIQVELSIQESEAEYFCQGIVIASLNLECSRCLNSFDSEVNNSIDFIACAELQHSDVNEKDILDTEDYAYFQGGDLQADISDILRQAIILSLSLKPLCSEDCKGLCAQCGINRNEQSCSCETKKIDPRWENLKTLSQQTTENKENS